ncbi:hypothetical protein LRS11_15980 [Pseudomonas sp. J452]|uniref:hypothetical protein n=1 Tax=Pseudomonas sp. J452 TaxID=2898441 RepID=UPI0021AE150A|nr:hypothetical protein [Pseudomonas sp. J452]UUY07313.1 hypothetical protein LRS11_15980 [Pseudomonas sp. J452]
MKNQHELTAAQKTDIDTWSEVYSSAHISTLLNIPLSRFLEDPQRCLEHAGQSTALTAMANGYRPLLPAQVAASQRIQKQWRERE